MSVIAIYVGGWFTRKAPESGNVYAPAARSAAQIELRWSHALDCSIIIRNDLRDVLDAAVTASRSAIRLEVAKLKRSSITVLCVSVACLLTGKQLHAQAVATTATVQVSCGSEPFSKKTPKVTIRWGSPNYNDNDFLNWKVQCDGQTHSQSIPLAHRKSQIEVQTEGGIETHYSLLAKIKAVGAEGDSFLQIDKKGSPDITSKNPRVTITRSSGPNQYGEQNFRVANPDGIATHVKIAMSSVNRSGSGQVALRWGHPDFDNTTDSRSPNPSIWKVKSVSNNGPDMPSILEFDLREKKSEFEIQTEGGTATGYHVSVWFGSGATAAANPDIDILHENSLPQVGWGGPVQISASNGNLYGEINVRVEDDQVIEPVVATPMPTTAGVNLTYVYGNSPAPASSAVVVAYNGTLPTGKAASPGAISFAVQGSVTPISGDNQSPAAPSNSSGLQPGLWTLTASRLIGSKPSAPRTCQGIQLAAGIAPIIVFKEDGSCTHTP